MTLEQFIMVNVIQKRLTLKFHFLRAQMKTVSVWSRSRLFLPGAGADPIWPEPESAPGPWTSGAGATQKSGGSATLLKIK